MSVLRVRLAQNQPKESKRKEMIKISMRIHETETNIQGSIKPKVHSMKRLIELTYLEISMRENIKYPINSSKNEKGSIYGGCTD